MMETMTRVDRLRQQADVAAVDILERIMRRQRWAVRDKEALAEFLFRFVLQNERGGRRQL